MPRTVGGEIGCAIVRFDQVIQNRIQAGQGSEGFTRGRQWVSGFAGDRSSDEHRKLLIYSTIGESGRESR